MPVNGKHTLKNKNMNKEENKEFVGGLTTALLLIVVAIVGIGACIQLIFNIF
jgi:hypothetical protein